jgi:hypothetical protein
MAERFDSGCSDRNQLEPLQDTINAACAQALTESLITAAGKSLVLALLLLVDRSGQSGEDGTPSITRSFTLGRIKYYV